MQHAPGEGGDQDRRHQCPAPVAPVVGAVHHDKKVVIAARHLVAMGADVVADVVPLLGHGIDAEMLDLLALPGLKPDALDSVAVITGGASLAPAPANGTTFEPPVKNSGAPHSSTSRCAASWQRTP